MTRMEGRAGQGPLPPTLSPSLSVSLASTLVRVPFPCLHPTSRRGRHKSYNKFISVCVCVCCSPRFLLIPVRLRKIPLHESESLESVTLRLWHLQSTIGTIPCQTKDVQTCFRIVSKAEIK